MFRRFAPMLIVPDVAEAAEWYTRTLGARLQHTLPVDPPYQWASLVLGDVEIMLARGDSARVWYSDDLGLSDTPSNFIGYIYVSDALGLYEQIREASAVLLEPTDQPYGMREFAIRDPFGFVLVFAEDLG